MKKNYKEWTKWDWFINDVKTYLSDPLSWLLILLVLIVIGLAIFVTVFIISVCTGQTTLVEFNNNTAFWTIYNVNTIIRNTIH